MPVVCLLLLGWSVARLPEEPLDRLKGRPLTAYRSVSVEIVRSDEGLEVIDPDYASWDRLSRLAQSQPGRVTTATFEVATRQSGPLYPSFERTEQRLVLRPWVDGAWSEEELEQARRAFFEWLGAAHPGFRSLPPENTVASRVLPGRLLADAGLVVVLLTAALSLAGMPRYVRCWVADRRLRRGLCGCCGYRLPEGEGGVRTCPECGAAWSRGS